jgi:molybdopterin-guanine dinucleotide biosynthesis protein A
MRYTQALKKKYDKPHITISCETAKINLVGNVRKAMELVETEFVYLIQHDMPFISSVNHTALIQTFQSHPDEVRLVRFSQRRTLVRNKDQLGICGNVEFQANGIELSKTHTWSDQ